MNINRYGNEEEALDAASAALEALLKRAYNAYIKNERRTLILLSGGSSLKLLDRVSDTYFGEYLTVTVLDERFDKDPKINNFEQITDSEFLEYARNAGCKFIDTRVKDGDTLEDAADRFDRNLREWVTKNPNGAIYAVIGMGPDGHVAGVLPDVDKVRFDKLFNDKEKWVAFYDVTGKNDYPLRFTTTLPFIQTINRAILFVPGEEKKNAFEKLLLDSGDLNTTPIRIVRKIEEIEIFTDIAS